MRILFRNHSFHQSLLVLMKVLI